MSLPSQAGRGSGHQRRFNSTASNAAAMSDIAAPGSSRGSNQDDRQQPPPPQLPQNPYAAGAVANGNGAAERAVDGDWCSKFPPTNADTARLDLSSPGEGMDGMMSRLDTLVTESDIPGWSPNGYYGQNGGGYSYSPLSRNLPPRPPDVVAGQPSSRTRNGMPQPIQGYGGASSQGYTNSYSPQPNDYAPPPQQQDPTRRYISNNDDRTLQYMANGGGRPRRRDRYP